MENEKKEKVITVQKILSGFLMVFAFFGVLSLIWAQWTLLQVCLTIVVCSGACMVILPEDW
jgi:uncharacterized membrane protein YjgN (DUF898 family)